MDALRDFSFGPAQPEPEIVSRTVKGSKISEQVSVWIDVIQTECPDINAKRLSLLFQ